MTRPQPTIPAHGETRKEALKVLTKPHDFHACVRRLKKPEIVYFYCHPVTRLVMWMSRVYGQPPRQSTKLESDRNLITSDHNASFTTFTLEKGMRHEPTHARPSTRRYNTKKTN
ncbi:hypothetical protein ACJJTC_001247 [Scirpophaga incertulas]